MKKILFSNIVFSVLVLFFGLIGSILISRVLGPAQRGEIAAILLWPSLLLYLGSFGTYQSVIYFFSKENRNLKHINGTFLYVTALNSIVSILVGSLLIFVTLHALSLHLKWYSLLLLVTLPFSIFNQLVASLLQAKSKFKVFNITRLFFPVVYFIGILFLFFFHILTVETIIWIQIGITLLQFLLFLKIYTIHFSTGFSLSIHKKTIKIIYNYGFKVWVGDLSQGLNIKMDQILISSLLLSADLGIYVVANSLASFTSIIPTAYKTVFLPKVASLKSHFDKKTLASKVLLQFFMLNGLTTVFALFCTPFALPMLFGDAFLAAIPIALILLVGYFFLNLKTVMAALVQGFGKPLFSSYAEIFGLVILVFLIYPLTVAFQLTGACVAISISYFFQFSFLYVLYLRYLNQNK
ncbi:oligosaccharide flippase family protein [Flavobacterium difficile]|uniref:Oligosaccharide flippase family protein n=1 Tax=Flavobacterium difficile TaxID=2709659 RepID=A0ABX0I6D7_9FLAO|nr:oligosaccharide flippase family protein [Flavobacterium difficile]NHM01090.1 oligosaccharide flippase family protein [Flavobacterium difficile]